MELSKMNLHIRDTGTTNNAKLTIHTQSGDIDTSGNLRITNKILSGVVANGTHDTDKFIFDDVSNNIISIGGTSETEYHLNMIIMVIHIIFTVKKLKIQIKVLLR